MLILHPLSMMIDDDIFVVKCGRLLLTRRAPARRAAHVGYARGALEPMSSWHGPVEAECNGNRTTYKSRAR